MEGASDSPSEMDLLEDDDEAGDGYRSGALYESMLVVLSNSIGPEILCRIVPGAKDFFVVRLRSGMGPDI